ncbi:MAG: hypothetical protein U0R68_09525 [Candidatus Nanopelagicales bacterium]
MSEPSEELPSTDVHGLPARRETATTAAAVLAGIEALAVALYAVSIGLAALRSPGSVASAPVVVVIFLVFALGIAACARGLWLRRRAARTPFGVIQLFGLVTGWTLTQGDGDSTHLVGYAVLAVSVVGIALVMSPAVGRDLQT